MSKVDVDTRGLLQLVLQLDVVLTPLISRCDIVCPQLMFFIDSKIVDLDAFFEVP